MNMQLFQIYTESFLPGDISDGFAIGDHASHLSTSI